MQIRVASRLYPFSHANKVTCLLPGSIHQVTLFPTRIQYLGKCIPSPMQGPVKNFTVVLDLEKGCVAVSGVTLKGFQRYFIFDRQGEVIIDRKPDAREVRAERLSLGSHRLQDWDQVTRRQDFREIFPAWLRLAELLPHTDTKEAYLLERLKGLDKTVVLEAFQHLFRAHFTGILTPRIADEEFQGLIPEDKQLPDGTCPLFILKEGGRLIRSLFIQEGETLSLLPSLPPAFHAGRFVDIRLQNGDTLDMEWSKKLLRRVVWRPIESRHVVLKLQNAIQSFRVRTSLKDKGLRISSNAPLLVTAGQTLYLDRFQK